MKKAGQYGTVFLIVLIVVACGSKKHEAESNKAAWPEMDEFHTIMAASFHPFKDSANLVPAKTNAAEMAKLAEKWASTQLPEKVDTDETKAKLTQLTRDANAFIQIAQAGDSVKVGEALTELHNQFHTLQEAWYGGKEEDHDHKH